MTVYSIEQTEFIFCACGCNELIPNKDKHDRIRKFKNHHHIKKENNPRWKNGMYLAHGYWFVLKPDHPFGNCRGYVKLHRLIMEKHLGRYMTKEEEIHHKNGIKSDNLFSNLQLMTKSNHTSLHHKKDMSDRFCLLCNSNKTKDWYKHQNGFICRKCYKQIKRRK